MENLNEILDSDNNLISSDVDDQYIISTPKFILLCLLTMGLYQIWWFYKAWNFYKQKEKSDIMPAARAIFSIIFLIPLMDRNIEFASHKGYQKSYTSVALFLGFLVLNALSRLPDPYWLLSLLGIACIVPTFNAFNYALQNSEDVNVIVQESFNGRQITLIVLGSILWALALLGMMVE